MKEHLILNNKINFDTSNIMSIDSLQNAIIKQRELSFNIDRVSDTLKSILSNYPTVENHFPHISTLDNSKIAIFENDIKLVKGVSTQIKIGKYLTRLNELRVKKGFYKLDENIIRDQADLYIVEQSDNTDLFIAQDDHDITKIYRSGIRSCMNNKCDYPTAYNDQVYLIYNSPDIKVIALMQGDRVLARTVVNAIDDTYTCIYSHTGFHGLMVSRLNLMGIEQSDRGIDQCRIAKLENDRGSYKLTYIDGSAYHVDYHDQDYLMVSYNGSGELCNEQVTCGYTDREDLVYCDHCESQEDEQESRYIDNESYSGTVCGHCLAQNFSRVIVGSYTYRDHHTNLEYDYVLDEDVMTDNTGRSYSQNGIDELCYYSEYEDQYIRQDQAVYSDYLEDYILLDDSTLVFNIDTDTSDHVMIDQIDTSNMFAYWNGDKYILAISGDEDQDDHINILKYNRAVIDNSIGILWQSFNTIYGDESDPDNKELISRLFDYDNINKLDTRAINILTTLKNRGYIKIGRGIGNDTNIVLDKLQGIYIRLHSQQQTSLPIVDDHFDLKNYNPVHSVIYINE